MPISLTKLKKDVPINPTVGPTVQLFNGDCLDILPKLERNSVDAIVTDPPYGLEFMGKEWDHGVPGVPFWSAMLNICKPGAFLLAFGGTRTFHRLACAIEDSGWEIRDTVMWVYGSGFPKSHDVSKAIDKQAGAKRPVIKETASGGYKRLMVTNEREGFRPDDYYPDGNKFTSNEPISEDAKRWSGWGTALKPAHEPILVGYKPLSGLQLVAAHCEEIHRCLCARLRVNDAEKKPLDQSATCAEVLRTVPEHAKIYELVNSEDAQFVIRRFMRLDAASNVERGNSARKSVNTLTSTAIQGRKTPHGEVDDFLNGLMDTCTSDMTDGISENTVLSWRNISDALLHPKNTYTTETGLKLIIGLRTLRSFLTPITTAGIGNLHPNWEPIIVARKPLEGTVAQNVLKHGVGGLNIDESRVGDERTTTVRNGKSGAHGRFGVDDRVFTRLNPPGRWPANLIHDGSAEVLSCFPKDEHRFFYTAKASKSDRGSDNTHPTVKPTALMEYLCKLVVPPGGTILDPMMGSGSTGVAAASLGYGFVGIEMHPPYFQIAERRISEARASV